MVILAQAPLQASGLLYLLALLVLLAPVQVMSSAMLPTKDIPNDDKFAVYSTIVKKNFPNWIPDAERYTPEELIEHLLGLLCALIDLGQEHRLNQSVMIKVCMKFFEQPFIETKVFVQHLAAAKQLIRSKSRSCVTRPRGSSRAL